MPRVVYNTATTIDGHIASPENSLAWLFAVKSEQMPDHEGFLEDIGVLVCGSTTYEWVLDEEDLIANPDKWPGYYGRRPMFVFTSRDLQIPDGADVRLVKGSPADHFAAINEAAGGKDIWLIGGGELVGQFFDAGLLTEVQLSIAPASLGAGAPLLPREIGSDRFRLEAVERFDQFVHLTYSVR
jgi:dihydrofolate reductase